MNHELDFPAGIWEPFAQNRPTVRCSAGYLIYLQDTQATCFYFLKSGRVKSFIQSEDGGSRVLHIYSAGNLFGEAAFFDGLPRVSSQDPELALSMTKYLARTVRLLSRQVDQMAFRPAQWRVADCLLTLSSDGGPACCTQDDIAAAVSASRVTVSRILNGFAKRGWVELGYRSVTLLDREALARLCRPS